MIKYTRIPRMMSSIPPTPSFQTGVPVPGIEYVKRFMIVEKIPIDADTSFS
jgi:hypothetical protein